MNTAESIKFNNLNDLMNVAEARGAVTQNWDEEATEYNFVDGSVLIVCNDRVATYESR